MGNSWKVLRYFGGRNQAAEAQIIGFLDEKLDSGVLKSRDMPNIMQSYNLIKKPTLEFTNFLKKVNHGLSFY